MGLLLLSGDSAPVVGSLSLVSAVAVRENVVRLTFSEPVYFSNVLDPGDASEPARYAVAPVVASVGSDGLPPRAVTGVLALLASPSAVDLWLDRRLSPYPSVYQVTANGLLSADLTDALTPGSSLPFFGLRAGLPNPTPDNALSNSDIANPQTLSGALDPLANPTSDVLGTLPVDDTGDLAHDEGLQSYKKRVLRRLSTRKGKFAHLPEYGTLAIQSVKMLARPGLVQQIAGDAESQIKQEPETVDAKVTVVVNGGLAFYRIRVRCSFGQTFNLTSPVVVTG